MATTALAIYGERWLDEVLLVAQGPADIMGAALAESFSLPAGFGDCAILNVEFRAWGIDVVSVGVTPVRGIRAYIQAAAGGKIVDNVGVAPWIVTQDTANAIELGCFIDPDALVLWQQDELLSITSPEMDTDATPTGELQIYAKVVHVRNVRGQEVKRPLKLVR